MLLTLVKADWVHQKVMCCLLRLHTHTCPV
uniref:Uncharacterized protein n=1 Tax=Anguilla anguilla TaxID=7936 RepID=A0A0E9XB30_ANGAN